MSDTIEERLAVLETKQEMLIKFLKEHMDEEEKQRDIQTARLETIEKLLTRQKGFIGGVVFVVSALWAVILAVVKFKTGS